MLFSKALLLPLALIVGSTSALPRVNETVFCDGGLCEKPTLAYERIIPAQPGYQWDDAGGYCGSWSIQRATLTRGAYISQQQVRDHTSPGGGHDEEILSTNIVEALTKLKLDFEGFDFATLPTPQLDAYFKWIKAQLTAGFPVVWMIMWNGQTYPIYGLKPPAGMYGHVEPVIGIQSNHPLNDTTVYDDDVVVHFTDGGVNTVHRPLTSMKGDWAGPGHQANCRPNSYCMTTYGFGWAIKDLADKNGMPANLAIQPSLQEPDTRNGETGIPLKGTLTVTKLETGVSYAIYRWDSVDEAFTYTDSYKKISFTATNATFVYKDDKSFQSDGTTYYRCVPAKSV